MGYYILEAPAPKWYGRSAFEDFHPPFVPLFSDPKYSPDFEGPCLDGQSLTPFEGPVKGFAPNGDKVLIFKVGQDTALLGLRAKWLNTFLGHIGAINPTIPRATAVEWVNFHFPKTAMELLDSLMVDGPLKLAMSLADAWKTA